MRAEGPSTKETTPLQSTALCIFPFTGSTGGDLLAWLMLLLRRSWGLWGTNREPLLLSLSPKMLCSSSANSVSDPISLPRPLKLKRLVLLLRLAENREPRMLSGDCGKNKWRCVSAEADMHFLELLWRPLTWGQRALYWVKGNIFKNKEIQQNDKFFQIRNEETGKVHLFRTKCAIRYCITLYTSGLKLSLHSFCTIHVAINTLLLKKEFDTNSYYRAVHTPTPTFLKYWKLIEAKTTLNASLHSIAYNSTLHTEGSVKVC